ncbi:hypothetical protein GCM10027168_21240 [Streptomyces capparidis]
MVCAAPQWFGLKLLPRCQGVPVVQVCRVVCRVAVRRGQDAARYLGILTLGRRPAVNGRRLSRLPGSPGAGVLQFIAGKRTFGERLKADRSDLRFRDRRVGSLGVRLTEQGPPVWSCPA